jgi:hypothetical protein
MALPGVNERAKRALVEELARGVRPLAGNWPIAGSAAMAAVRKRLPHGASNRFMSDPGAFNRGFDPLGLVTFASELRRVVRAESLNLEIDTIAEGWNIDLSRPMQPTDPRRITVAENTGYLALTKGGANCQYQAGATFLILKAAGVRPVDVIYIYSQSGKARHATCVIGIQDGFPNPCEPEISRWQPKAVVADTWETDRTESVKDLVKRYPPHEHRFYSFARFG